ncbi:MAG: zinc ribbon-containing protein [Candidatus Competibacteraceae bacterium]
MDRTTREIRGYTYPYRAVWQAAANMLEIPPMTEPSHSNRLAQAYNQMIERVKTRLEELEQAEKEAFPRLHASIEHAAEKAVELGELTREEARLIGGYLKRDLEDAGQYLATTGHDLRTWLRFDLELLEDRLLDFFQRGVDQSRLDLLAFEEPAPGAEIVQYRSGEITGPGTLQCDSCGEPVVFHAPAAIAPCPMCDGTTFVRVTEEP